MPGFPTTGARSSTRFCRRSGASCGAWWPRQGHGRRRSVATPNRPWHTERNLGEHGEKWWKNGENWWKLVKKWWNRVKIGEKIAKNGENWWTHGEQMVKNWWKLAKKWWTHGENQREQWDFRWTLIVIHIFIVYFHGFWSTYIDLIWILDGLCMGFIMVLSVFLWF